jgi:hypothetical protein
MHRVGLHFQTKNRRSPKTSPRTLGQLRKFYPVNDDLDQPLKLLFKETLFNIADRTQIIKFINHSFLQAIEEIVFKLPAFLKMKIPELLIHFFTRHD